MPLGRRWTEFLGAFQNVLVYQSEHLIRQLPYGNNHGRTFSVENPEFLAALLAEAENLVPKPSLVLEHPQTSQNITSSFSGPSPPSPLPFLLYALILEAILIALCCLVYHFLSYRSKSNRNNQETNKIAEIFWGFTDFSQKRSAGYQTILSPITDSLWTLIRASLQILTASLRQNECVVAFLLVVDFFNTPNVKCRVSSTLRTLFVGGLHRLEDIANAISDSTAGFKNRLQGIRRSEDIPNGISDHTGRLKHRLQGHWTSEDIANAISDHTGRRLLRWTESLATSILQQIPAFTKLKEERDTAQADKLELQKELDLEWAAKLKAEKQRDIELNEKLELRHQLDQLERMRDTEYAAKIFAESQLRAKQLEIGTLRKKLNTECNNKDSLDKRTRTLRAAQLGAEGERDKERNAKIRAEGQLKAEQIRSRDLERQFNIERATRLIVSQVLRCARSRRRNAEEELAAEQAEKLKHMEGLSIAVNERREMEKELNRCREEKAAAVAKIAEQQVEDADGIKAMHHEVGASGPEVKIF